MHPGAFEFVARYKTDESIRVIEIGSRIINEQASIRTLFPNATWTGLDLISGPGVDVVMDARDYQTDDAPDMVICCEVFEHFGRWRQLIGKSREWLRPGGVLLITCAGFGREPHSAIDGGEIRQGEWYANLLPSEIAAAIEFAGMTLRCLSTNQHWRDIYADAEKH